MSATMSIGNNLLKETAVCGISTFCIKGGDLGHKVKNIV